MNERVDPAPDIEDEVRVEVSRRLAMILENPDVLEKYDRDGDGELDDEERLVLRAVIEAEVVRDLDDSPTTAEPSDDKAERDDAAPKVEWSIEREVAAPHLDQPILEVVDQRYDVLREIGAGSQGRTYLARRREDDEYVALKELSFDRIDDWKSLELFEREGEVLRRLAHPAIPTFLDSFHVEVEGQPPRLFLVQEFVSGESLDVALAHGRYFSEDDLRSFTFQMLDVLEHLHSRTPPIVHRDLKPSNIILEDGAYRLVDFGAVQLVMPGDIGGSTVVGTTGYMPPEQLAGRASPQSDLYALGATLVHMATHTHPAKLPAERLKLRWRDRAKLSHQFVRFIDRLIEPVAEDRVVDASEARTLLQTTPPPARSVSPAASTVPEVTRPADANVNLFWEDDTMVIDMSRSRVAPTAIGSILGLCAGIALSLITGNWSALAGLLGFGFFTGIIWPVGPDEQLRVRPDGSFHFIHADGRVHREASGRVDRFALDGNRLHLQSDTGALIDVGAHLTPGARRWLFGAVDAHLRSDPRTT